MLMSIISFNLYAQTRVDGFDSYDAMIGKEVRLYNVVSMAEHQGYFAYDFDGSKPKLIKDDAIYRELQKNNIYVKEIVKHKKHSYLKVTVKGKSLYLILDDGFNYLANARSVSYWTEQNDRYVTLYSHLYAGSNIVAGDYKRIYPYVVLSKYIPITWCPIASMPENINDEVLFKFTVTGRPMIEFAVSEAVMKMYEADFLLREKFAAEDKKQKEAAETRNRADSLVYQAEKTLEEVGDKVSEDDKAPVREAVEKLKKSLEANDTEAMKADSEALEKAFYAISEKLYAQQGGAQGAGFDAGAQQGADDTVYDADFEDKTGDNN